MLVWFLYNFAIPMILGHVRLLPDHLQSREDQVDADDRLLHRKRSRYHEIDEEQPDAEQRDNHECEHLWERLLDISVVASVQSDELYEAPDDEHDEVDDVEYVVVNDGQSRQRCLLVAVNVDHHVHVDDVVVDVVVYQLLHEQRRENLRLWLHPGLPTIFSSSKGM